ncbi:hypothetical protein [Paenibacillus sp. MMS18-CY102]|uniref:hypothetical protein n=1 Tax=Paenibacillus sp. MMS18-CY102 TaxID=2682849 RepID=UPI0013AAE8A1|nr:hypothetical protein [Paenibacillus sp. MMS18-CY102]MWC31247.1 hypothetical protein [Paenibacillus sp. MMS18-CY102]
MDDYSSASVFGGFGILLLFFMFFALILAVIHIVTIVWAFRDALRHGKEPLFALGIAIMIFFFPIIGFIVYLLIRKSS